MNEEEVCITYFKPKLFRAKNGKMVLKYGFDPSQIVSRTGYNEEDGYMILYLDMVGMVVLDIMIVLLENPCTTF